VSTDTPSVEQLNALPYLDAVVKEALRLYAPVHETSRVALKDDVIPLDEPYTDKRGVVYRELRCVSCWIVIPMAIDCQLIASRRVKNSAFPSLH
jgi:hypothetical protein